MIRKNTTEDLNFDSYRNFKATIELPPGSGVDVRLKQQIGIDPSIRSGCGPDHES